MRAPSQFTNRARGARRTTVLAAIALVVVVASAGAAITGSGVKDGTLWGRDVADNSLTGRDVRNGSLSSIDIRNGGLGGYDLRDGTVTGSKVRNGSIGSEHLVDGAIGGAHIADGAIGASKLGFGVVTSAEFAALAAPGFVNNTTNPVAWSKLQGVPAGFADGIDNVGSGDAGDLSCSACVDASDLATGAVSSDELLDGSVAVADLGYDPATQGELDAHATNLSGVGTVNTGSNPVDWSKLKNVPVGVVDGDDVDGGTAADLGCTGCVAAAELGFDPATQGELDAVSSGLSTAGTINTGSNPVDWSRLKNVPGPIADGTDAIDGGVAANLNCNMCLTVADIAPGAVSGNEIADGTVAVGDLAFDPATQGELDALETALSVGGAAVNTAGNAVNWNALLNVPAGLADGTDDTIAFGGANAAPTTIADNTTATITVDCTAGDHAISGTYASTGGADMAILASGNSDVDTWSFTVLNEGPGTDPSWDFTPSVICLAASVDT